MASLLLFSWLWPLLLIPALPHRYSRFWLPLAPLPALAATLLLPAGSQLSLPWLLLGTELGIDAISRVFLGFSALLWLFACLHTALTTARERHGNRFQLFMLLAMSGNLGLIVGDDMISFYLGFAVMGLASYGLIIHSGDAAAKRAARIYLVMTLVAEFLLLVALMQIYQRTQDLTPSVYQLAGGSDIEILLLVVAFGIKAGMVGLHVWLPLAHPAAPVAASAVLSGTMIKTALLGWMQFLPLGAVALADWGSLLVWAGVVGSVLVVPVGLVQRDPKVILAYSSIGKMSLLIAVLGVALTEPKAAPTILAALALYALFHGLNKGALFIGVGVIKHGSQRWLLIILAIPALVISGAPLLAGAGAKQLLTESLPEAANASQSLLGLMTIAAVTTPLLLARFLWCCAKVQGKQPMALPLMLPWLLLVLTALCLPTLLLPPLSLGSPGLWLTALVLAAAVVRCSPSWLARWVGTIPPGDLLVVIRPAPMPEQQADAPKTRPGLWRQQLLSQCQRLADYSEHSLNSRPTSLRPPWSLSLLMPLLMLLMTMLLISVPGT